VALDAPVDDDWAGAAAEWIHARDIATGQSGLLPRRHVLPFTTNIRAVCVSDWQPRPDTAVMVWQLGLVH
jgi:hypothetical protein